VLPEALMVADEVLIGPVNRAQLLGEDERLSPEHIANSLLERGRAAKAFESADEIADYLAENAKTGDVVMVMSNGSFDGLSGKVLERLKSLAGTRR
jgi:UDP-N-acetylmuramate: L-alanyl-gamma-D-glutamyl-meso-diaminopimelate ligase